MAINAAKQLLDELMGRERDLAPNDKKSGMDWNDSRVRFISNLFKLIQIN
jgi:hypothetical protein